MGFENTEMSQRHQPTRQPASQTTRSKSVAFSSETVSGPARAMSTLVASSETNEDDEDDPDLPALICSQTSVEGSKWLLKEDPGRPQSFLADRPPPLRFPTWLPQCRPTCNTTCHPTCCGEPPITTLVETFWLEWDE